MVRCIMAVLLLVGERKEQPDVVSALLDVSSLPGKPHYNMAADEPLVLHQCGFDRLTIQRSPRVLYDLTQHFEMLWEKATIAASRARNALQFIATCSVREEDVEEFGQEKAGGCGEGVGVRGEKCWWWWPVVAMVFRTMERRAIFRNCSAEKESDFPTAIPKKLIPVHRMVCAPVKVFHLQKPSVYFMTGSGSSTLSRTLHTVSVVVW